MSNELIVVRQLPIIEEHLRALAADIDKKVADAKSLVCTEDTYKDVKRIRAELSAQFKELEAQRIAVKKAVLDPYSSFEDIYKECVSSKFKDADAVLKAKITDVEDGLKKQKEDEVRSYFTEYCSNLGIDFIAFEQSGISVTMAASKKSLKEKAKDFLDRKMDDLALIETQEFKDEILVEFKQTLNASQAITSAIKRHAAIDEERKRREAAIAERMARHQAEEKVDAAICNDDSHGTPFSPPEMSVQNEPEPRVSGAPHDTTQHGSVFAMTFTVRGTIEQLREIKSFLTNGGYQYE